jgi:hypothetical protein
MATPSESARRQMPNIEMQKRTKPLILRAVFCELVEDDVADANEGEEKDLELHLMGSSSKTLISPREGKPLALARGARKSLTPKNAERRRQMLNCE